MNPGVSQANITRSVNGTRYHSLQVELRRRLSNGLMVSGNYTLASKTQSAFTFLPAAARSVRMDPVFLQQHRHPALVQGQLAVGAAVRQGTPLRRGHERLRQRAARRLGFLRDRTIPDAAGTRPRRDGSSA